MPTKQPYGEARYVERQLRRDEIRQFDGNVVVHAVVVLETLCRRIHVEAGP